MRRAEEGGLARLGQARRCVVRRVERLDLDAVIRAGDASRLLWLVYLTWTTCSFRTGYSKKSEEGT